MKKKTLFLMTVAGAFCTMFCSCKKQNFNEDAKQQIVDNYNTSFKAYVGGTISPTQDWGFGSSLPTEAATRGQMDHYYLADNYAKLYEKSYFQKMLQLLPNNQRVAAGIITNYEFEQRGPFRFDIIFGATNEDKVVEIGYYYYNPKTQSAHNHTAVKLVGNFVNDLAANNYYQVTKYSTPLDDQWETPRASRGNFLWTDDEKFLTERCRMFTLEAKDVPVGCYVGFYMVNADYPNDTTFTNKYLNRDQQNPYFAVLDETETPLSGSYVVGIEDRAKDDYDCNDVVLAVHKNIENTFPLLVIPTESEQPWSRIIAEDLNTHGESTDFDFNDIVLDVQLTKTGANCILQAAGATLPIRINQQDELEVHKLFKVGQSVMVNTNASKHGLSGQDGLEPVKFSIEGNFTSINDVNIEVFKGGQWIKLYAWKGGPACKLVVDNSFVWPDERQSLKEKYPKFVDWVKDSSVKWY